MSAALADRGPASTPRRRPQEDAGGPADAGELVSGVTARWGPHHLTEARAREFGLDLLRWPLDEPAAGWEQDAACRGVDSEVADQLSEVLSQLAATELVSRWCAACPVRTECLATGRTTGGHGVWGSIVLREGHVAPWRTATERSRRAKLTEPTETTVPIEETENTVPIEDTVPIEETVPAEITELIDGKMPAEITVPTETTVSAEITELIDGKMPAEITMRRRGQRPQPHRLTRARRRGRHAPVA